MEGNIDIKETQKSEEIITAETNGTDNFNAKVKKKLGTFKKGIIIYSTVLVVLAIVLLVTLWVFLSSFQKSHTQGIAHDYINGMNENDWRGFLAENIFVSEYENADDALDKAYGELIKGKNLRCNRSAAECTDGRDVYYISNGNSKICSISLVKDGTGAFGFDRWRVEGISPIKGALDLFNPYLSVILPKDAMLFINGEEAIASDDNTTPYSIKFSTDSFVRYSFRKPWCDYSIAAECDGTALVCTADTEKEKVYELPEEMVFNYTITVPEGSELYFDDLRLSTDYISENDSDYPFISPLEKNMDNAPKSTVYTLKSKKKDAELKVIYDGKELKYESTAEGIYNYALPYEPLTYTVMAPADVTVTVNGINVSENRDYISDDNIVYDAVSDYEELLTDAKFLRKYKFEGLLFAPTISVTDAEGTECPLTVDSATDYSCTSAPSQALITEYTVMAKEFCYAMMDYMFRGKEVIDATMNAAISHTKFQSPAYNAIYGAYWGMYWRQAHTIYYNNVTVDNFISYADNAFRCDINYDVTGTRIENGKVENAKGIYRVLYINNGTRWEIVELTLISADE